LHEANLRKLVYFGKLYSHASPQLTLRIDINHVLH